MRALPRASAVAAVLVLGTSARAQDVERVAVRVTTVSSGAVYLDRGRSAGIASGDQLILHVASGVPLLLQIGAVSSGSARADLPPGTVAPRPGDAGEVIVSSGRAVPDTAQAVPVIRAPPVEHPPWTDPQSGWDQDAPLLAPAFGQGPAARPTRWWGRVIAQYDGTFDGGLDEHQYHLFRAGIDTTIENPANDGGRIHFAGEITSRAALLDDAPDDTSVRGRIDRLSYATADTPAARYRLEVGRFLPAQVPELGVIDGAEVLLPAGAHGRFGVSFGAFPEPFPATGTGDDIQTAVSYRFVGGADDWFSGDIAYQKTWHRGAPDRDLVFADVDARPTQDFWLHSSLWADYYGDSDSAKSKGFQVTELDVQASYRLNPANGVGLGVAHIRWPQLLRKEFNALPPDQLRDGRLFRLGVNSWHDLSRVVRLEARVDWWQDQDDDGASEDVRLALRDLLYEDGEVSFGAFHTDGALTRGTGFRCGLNRRFGSAFVDLRYELSTYTTDNVSGSEDLIQQSAGASASFPLSQSTDVSFHLDYWFGDAQNALAVGLFSQVRF